jgi:hypothetical protein
MPLTIVNPGSFHALKCAFIFRKWYKPVQQDFDPALHSERGTIAEKQGPSENANSEVNLTRPKTDSSSCFGIATLFIFFLMGKLNL